VNNDRRRYPTRKCRRWLPTRVNAKESKRGGEGENERARERERGRKRIKTTRSGLFQPARNEHRVKSFIIYNTRATGGGSGAGGGDAAEKSQTSGIVCTRTRTRTHTGRGRITFGRAFAMADGFVGICQEPGKPAGGLP